MVTHAGRRRPGIVRRVRALVIVNPRATATTARERDVLARAVGSETDLTIEHTNNRGHASALACRAMRDGVDVVIAMGGDGTVNEVVNGLLTDGVHDQVPTLGVVPAGSTNVFARALGLPNDAIESTALLLDALREGRQRTISLGRLDIGDDIGDDTGDDTGEERWFVFAAGVGFDAGIIARVEKHRGRGRRSSDILYARAGVPRVLRNRSATPGPAARTCRRHDRRRPALRHRRQHRPLDVSW